MTQGRSAYQAHQPRRRGVVTVVTVGGSWLLGRSLSADPDSSEFYRRTFCLAGVWAGGGVLAGPLHPVHVGGAAAAARRPRLTAVAAGAGAFGVFYAAALGARHVPLLDAALVRALRFADQGDPTLVTLTALANGVAEEVFFRGALYAAFDERHAAAASTAVYVAVTVATRNPALVVAAGAMGTVFALQRRASGGILAPALTHLTWSALMLRYLPRQSDGVAGSVRARRVAQAFLAARLRLRRSRSAS